MSFSPTEERNFLEPELEKVDNVCVTSNENYYAEIYAVMHAFGDVTKPLESSIRLMYNILRNQMGLLIKNAEKIMKLRKSKKISHEDLLFLMRKNKILLKRLLLFLFVEDSKASLFYSSCKKMEDKFSPENGERVSKCLQYLALIEKFTGDLTSVLSDKNVVDHVYMKRLKRKDLMTNYMTKEEYEHFNKYTLRVTFYQKYTVERFKRWLLQCSCIDVEIKPLALSIIHFLARETVAKIVDKALEIKSRKYEKRDKFSLETSSYTTDLVPELKHNLDEPGSNLQSFFYIAPENSSINDDYDAEDVPTDSLVENKSNINSSSSSARKRKLSPNISYDIDNKESGTVTTQAKKRNLNTEKHSFTSTLNNAEKHDKYMISPHLEQNNSLKCCVKKKTNYITKASKNFNNSELDNDVYPNVYYVDNGNVSSTTNRVSEGFSDVLLHLSEISKVINKESCFSLNFEEKQLSICYDGSKTFETNTSPFSKVKTACQTDDMEIIDFITSCPLEFIEESDLEDFQTEDCDLESLLYGSEVNSSHFQCNSSTEKDSEIHWFPEEAIISEEIQAAFVYYQQPLYISNFMRSKIPCLSERKINLVCLAIPD